MLSLAIVTQDLDHSYHWHALTHGRSPRVLCHKTFMAFMFWFGSAMASSILENLSFNNPKRSHGGSGLVYGFMLLHLCLRSMRWRTFGRLVNDFVHVEQGNLIEDEFGVFKIFMILKIINVKPMKTMALPNSWTTRNCQESIQTLAKTRKNYDLMFIKWW